MLKQRTEVHHLNSGKDYRKIGLTHAQVYFTYAF